MGNISYLESFGGGISQSNILFGLDVPEAFTFNDSFEYVGGPS